VSPSIEAFLFWQIAASLAETLLNAAALWRSLPGVAAARFRKDLLLATWRFAAGVTGISALAVILTQLDKIILSSVLSLEGFGYYSLASRVAGALYGVVNPVIASVFPRFSQLSALRDEHELARVYHLACQLMSVLILPLAVVLGLWAHELLWLWTRNQAIADNAHLALSLLAAGNALNALMSLPGALQLAHGWTRLGLAVSVVAVPLFAPLLYFMSLSYGGTGAAAVWVALNAIYVLLLQGLMHRRLLRGELWRWYRSDVAPPLLAAAAVGGLWKWLVPFPESAWAGVLSLCLVSAATLAAAIAAAPEIRATVRRGFASLPLSAR
jgi:O-antigen/teichoic acid export membrane protein